MSWERSANGPEWWDIAHIIAEIEKTHRCVVYVLVLHDGQRGAPAMQFLCTAQREGQLSEELYDPVGTSAKWPCADHKRVEGAVFEALFQLDIACTKAWWSQQELFA